MMLCGMGKYGRVMTQYIGIVYDVIFLLLVLGAAEAGRRRDAGPGIRCIFSTEPPLAPAEAVDPAADFYVRGRLRPPMGSLHAVTAAAGLRAARETLAHLLEPPCA